MGNRYGHPSPEVLAALEKRGAHVLRTDDVGSIVVSIDGSRDLTVTAEDTRWTIRRSTAPVTRRDRR
jgi:beta-lactamase superfamily II metal-dependent hydrolase